ncbi:MAG: hypothetical protein H0T41_15605, partial [Rhodobacteraceae bacterium]|nr:hypothetical protein [Paracoccaceae bacterium]
MARVTVAIDGATHFEIVPAEPVNVDDFDDFLKDAGKLLDRDDEDDDEDDRDEDDEDEDDGDEDDED